MTKAIVYTLILMVLFYCTHALLPWWSLAVAAFLAGAWLPYKRGHHAAFSLFFAAAVVWIFPALLADIQNESLLSGRMAELTGIGSTAALLVVTAVMGGIMGMLFGMSGRCLRGTLPPTPLPERSRRQRGVGDE